MLRLETRGEVFRYAFVFCVSTSLAVCVLWVVGLVIMEGPFSFIVWVIFALPAGTILGFGPCLITAISATIFGPAQRQVVIIVLALAGGVASGFIFNHWLLHLLSM
jgi:hypothetical protein